MGMAFAEAATVRVLWGWTRLEGAVELGRDKVG